MSVSLVADLTGAAATDKTKQTQSVFDANTDSEFNQLLQGADSSAAPADILKDITSGGMAGYWAWQIKQMEQNITQQVMSENNLTADQVAKMPADQRAEVEAKIIKEVKHRLEMWMDEELRKKKTDSANQLSGDTLGTLLSENEIGNAPKVPGGDNSSVPDSVANDLTSGKAWL